MKVQLFITSAVGYTIVVQKKKEKAKDRKTSYIRAYGYSSSLSLDREGALLDTVLSS